MCFLCVFSVDNFTLIIYNPWHERNKSSNLSEKIKYFEENLQKQKEKFNNHQKLKIKKNKFENILKFSFINSKFIFNKISEEILNDLIQNNLNSISKNQKDAPTLPDMETIGIDSVSISLHKYFGNTMVNSVVIARNKPVCEYVDYIGITDSTICGSRSFSPFSTLQRITETFERKSSEDYCKNIILFEKLLKENKVSYLREEKSNIFIINKPDDKICKKFQLSTFKNAQGKEKAHIIIFPHHQEDIIRELVNSLTNN